MKRELNAEGSVLFFSYFSTCTHVGIKTQQGIREPQVPRQGIWVLPACLAHTDSHTEIGLAFRGGCLCLGTSFLTSVIRSTLSRDLTTVMFLYFKTLWVSTGLRINGSTPKFKPVIIEFASASLYGELFIHHGEHRLTEAIFYICLSALSHTGQVPVFSPQHGDNICLTWMLWGFEIK